MKKRNEKYDKIENYTKSIGYNIVRKMKNLICFSKISNSYIFYFVNGMNLICFG